MTDLKQFAESSNGDRWLLGRDAETNQPFVMHLANLPSGGYETRTPLQDFLDKNPTGPEQEALKLVWDEKHQEIADQPKEIADQPIGSADALKTPSLVLAEDYLRLGGTRHSKVDDNIVSTRQWEDEPAEASAFWEANIEPLGHKSRQEVELHLPSISDT
jgi:hypothetical protein